MSEIIDTGEYQNTSSGGGCGKVLLWLFFIALILSCLCCAGFLGIGYYFEKALDNGFVEDPVLAQKMTEENLGELNLPEYIKPRKFFEVKMFGKRLGFASIYGWNVAGEAVTTDAAETPVAAIEEAVPVKETPIEAVPAEENASENSELNAFNDYETIIFYVMSSSLGINEARFISCFFPELLQNKDYTVKRMETTTVTINGKASDFTFSWMECEDAPPLLMVSGIFTSPKEPQCNVLIVLPGDVSQEAVIEVLENIQK